MGLFKKITVKTLYPIPSSGFYISTTTCNQNPPLKLHFPKSTILRTTLKYRHKNSKFNLLGFEG